MQLPAKALRESVSCLHGRRRWSAAGSEVAIYWAIAGCELLILIMWAMSLRVKTKTTPQALELVRTTTNVDQNAILQTRSRSPGTAQSREGGKSVIVKARRSHSLRKKQPD